MLTSGKLQSLSADDYNTALSTNGSCGFFGLDTTNQQFRVPSLNAVYIKSGQTPANFGAESLPNINGQIFNAFGWNSSTDGAFTRSIVAGAPTGEEDGERINITLDASQSSSTYQDEAKVNPDHVVYKAYVVLASAKAESSTEVANYQLYNTVPLLTPIFHPEEIVDANWLKSAGQWNDGSVYAAVYNELTEDYATGTNEEDTIDGITISYRLTAKKRRICMPDQITNITDLFAATGIAWYYVLDTANTQFRLPQSKYGFVGSRNNVGGYVKESLPNITGYSAAPYFIELGVPNGCFSPAGSANVPATGNTNNFVSFDIDASRSSSTYQDGAPVQERAIEAYLYFKVGNATENAQTINVGVMTNALAGKLDADFGNATAGGKATTIDWGIPDYSAGVTLNSTELANGYTPPCAGVVICYNVASSKMTQWYVNDVFIFRSIANNSNNFPVQVSLGSQDVLKVTGTLTDLSNIMFYPYKGVSGNA